MKHPAVTTRTLTRADFLEAIHATCPQLSRAEARELFEQTIDGICFALERGEDVNLRSFGSFTTRHKRERIGRNPRTGTPAAITPRRVTSFKASPRLIHRVNGGDAGATFDHE